METLHTTQSLLQGYKVVVKKTRRTERGDLLELFLSRINPARLEKKLTPLSIAFMSRFFSMRKMDVSQVYQFYKDCDRANNFSAYFWWSTKNR